MSLGWTESNDPRDMKVFTVIRDPVKRLESGTKEVILGLHQHGLSPDAMDYLIRDFLLYDRHVFPYAEYIKNFQDVVVFGEDQEPAIEKFFALNELEISLAELPRLNQSVFDPKFEYLRRIYEHKLKVHFDNFQNDQRLWEACHQAVREHRFSFSAWDQMYDQGIINKVLRS